MKIIASCSKCFFESMNPQFRPALLQICDNGQYEMTCEKGHHQYILLQQEKFEILFEMGAHALIDGYVREAATSFAAAVERFHEFCIEVMFYGKVAEEDKVKTWKLVANQSERQLGAFYLLYLLEFKKQPSRIIEDCAGFRNKVVHKGYIPTLDECLAYGDTVLSYIRQVIGELKISHEANIQGVVHNKLTKLMNGIKHKEDKRINTTSIKTIISLVAPIDASINQIPFGESLEILKKEKDLFKNIR